MAGIELEEDDYQVVKLLVCEMISGAEECLTKAQREEILEQLVVLVSDQDLEKIEKEKKLAPGELAAKKKAIMKRALRKAKDIAEVRIRKK